MGLVRGANAYAKVGVESGVMSASPHQLIAMLFDAALASIRTARLHMEAGAVDEKGKAVSKAIDIINGGLIAGLDEEQGGELAKDLERLYEYVVRILLQANLRNDLQQLDEASELLANIASAWREVGLQVNG